MGKLLKSTPNKKQLLAVQAWQNETITEIVYGGAKYGGKSFLGCSLIFGDALMYPETIYYIARKTLSDLRRYTSSSVSEIFKFWGLNMLDYCSYNGQDNCYNFKNGSKVFFIECKYLPSDPDFTRFGSAQFTRGWIEEAGEVHGKAVINLSAATGRWMNKKYNLPKKTLLTMNPNKGYAYREFYWPSKEGKLKENRAFITALPQDNIYGDKEYIASLFRDLKGSERERLLFGNWEYDNDPAALISYDAIQDYFNGEHIKPEGNKYITCDVARKGKDKTVIRVWHGFVCIKRYEMAKSLVTEVATKVKDAQRVYKVSNSNTIVDEDGVGGGVVDIVKCKGFVNNSRPLKDENYENLKSQCSVIIAKMIEARELGELCEDQNVIEMTGEEMEQVKIKNLDKDGKIGINGKDVMSEKLGRSPDDWDTIMMRGYFTLAKKFFVV